MSGGYQFPTVCKKLKPDDKVLMILMKLRLGLQNKDLAYRYKLITPIMKLHNMVTVLSALDRALSYKKGDLSEAKGLTKCMQKASPRVLKIEHA